jgi:hypothetical protein
MAYSRGDSKNIIVGAAALFTYDSVLTNDELKEIPVVDEVSYRNTLTTDEAIELGFKNVGYTMNGLEIVFQPDFGEVQVDQLLDVAKLYKQGMQVNLNTAFAEATLENLLFSIAGKTTDLDKESDKVSDPDPDLDGIDQIDNSMFKNGKGTKVLDLLSGDIGECPVERGLIAVGPGTGDCEAGSTKERIYVAYRALSIENVTVSAKRDEPTMYEVSFRLLPNDDTGSYGKIIDRTIPAAPNS